VQGRITFRDSQTDKPHKQCGRGVPLWMEMGSWVHSRLSSLAETLARAVTIPLSENGGIYIGIFGSCVLLVQTVQYIGIYVGRTASSAHILVYRLAVWRSLPEVPPQISSYLLHAMRFRSNSLGWLTAKETDIRIHSHCAWIQTSGSSC
jgi:hypothetical protein